MLYKKTANQIKGGGYIVVQQKPLNTYMTKSELILTIATKQPQLQHRDIELAVKSIVEILTTAVASREGN